MVIIDKKDTVYTLRYQAEASFIFGSKAREISLAVRGSLDDLLGNYSVCRFS